MNSGIISLFIFYWLSIFSILGYGISLTSLLNYKKPLNHLGYQGLIGILFLIIYSYISNIFYPHTQIHNFLILLFGLVIFIFQLGFKKKVDLKNFKLMSALFLVLFISILIYKAHDDFPYYHFPYSYYLTQFSLMIGIGQFNHGFNTPSSIFYLNSLYYLPITKYGLFHIPVLLIFGFSNLILIEKLLKFLKKNKPNYLSYFLMFSLIFINVFFYRLGEHGTDRSAQILIFILVYELINLLNDKKNFSSSLSKVFLLLSIIITLKAFYILYLILLLPIFLFIYSRIKFKVFELVIKNKFFAFLIISFLLVVTTNFFNSGCFLYPVTLTCLENLPWAHSVEHVSKMNNWYEQWSKAGAGPNFRVEDPKNYIMYFNWVPNWIDEYFFNKISDFLLGLIFISLISLILVIYKSKKIINKKRKILSIYICLIILFFEWFYNHPSLRYGGYVLIGLLIFIPISFFLEKFSNKNIKLRIKTLVMIAFFVFVLRNIDRINNEIEKYKYSPIDNPYYKVDKNHYRIDKKLKFFVNSYNNCINNQDCQDHDSNRLKKAYGKFYFLNNN